jgi:hypothetical protein
LNNLLVCFGSEVIGGVFNCELNAWRLSAVNFEQFTGNSSGARSLRPDQDNIATEIKTHCKVFESPSLAKRKDNRGLLGIPGSETVDQGIGRIFDSQKGLYQIQGIRAWQTHFQTAGRTTGNRWDGE